MIPRDEIQLIGGHPLAEEPNPVARVRLLRDVLRLPATDPELDAAKAELIKHPWVLELAGEQKPDGSWGRFHSMDSDLKKRFPTSEIAIRRALALGLEKHDPVLAGAVRYMEAVLSGQGA